MWGFMCFVRFYSVNYICESISVKVKLRSKNQKYAFDGNKNYYIFQAKKVNETIYQLTNILRYADMHKEVSDYFIMYVKSKPS